MKLRALIVDDSRVMRNMVKDALRRTELADFDYAEASDGAEAIKMFDPDKIDIAFIDWNMPKMTGIDFVRKVRSDKKADRIPLVMVTSEKTMEKVEMALGEAGADAYISKPFTVKELQFKLKQVLDSRANRSSGFFNKL
jgi:two-component system, chemotaxis family, chemotaxis protein CheY